MLEEIIACFLTLFSALTMDTPRVSRDTSENHNTSQAPDQSELSYCLTCEDKIHSEYTTFEEENFPSSTEYVQLGFELRFRPTYIQSLRRSLKATLSLTFATLPLVLIFTALIYFDLRTCDLCSEWVVRNYTISFEVKKMRMLGDSIEVVFCNLWFPLSLIALFGWRKFTRHYSSTVLVGLLAALLNALYLSFLLLYGVYDRKSWYRVAGNVTCAVGVTWGCVIVTRNIRKNHPTVSYSDRHIFTVISIPILCSMAMAMIYRFVVVKLFNSLNNTMYKFVVAIFTPTLAIVPTAILKHMALKRTSKIIDQGRSFVLVYFMRTAWITLYRIMQADFKSIWLFVGLSLLSGVAGLLKVATVGVRERVWTRIIEFLREKCRVRLQVLPGNTPHSRRLKADTEIQNVLFENNSLILSQVYIVLYMMTSFVQNDWAVVRESLIRVTIGLGLEFVFNLLSIFVRIHWHNIPIARVWSKQWKRHMFANGVILAILVCYFTEVLLTVFQVRFNGSSNTYVVRNCTLPYVGWR